MENEDYESLPEGTSTSNYMLAGSCAGVMEHSIMYPIDCVKTRLQCIRPPDGQRYLSLTNGMYQLVSQEGFARSFRGIGAVMFGAGPAHAFYFGLYEYMKSLLIDPASDSNYISHAISGACATIVHDAIMTPTDAVKQRLQMFNSPYHNSWDCLQRVVRTDGIRVLYRAYLTQLFLNIPFQCIHFVAYEKLQDILNPSHIYLPWTHIVSGGLAGSFAAAVTTPMDVCKTVLNLQPQAIAKEVCSTTNKPKLIRGMFSAGRLVIQTRGIGGLFLGLNARVLATLPGTAISWSVYEYFKWYLSVRQSHQLSSSSSVSIIPATVSMESELSPPVFK